MKRDLDLAKFEQARFHRGLLAVELLRLKQARVLRAMRLKFSITKMHIDGAEAILSVWQGNSLDRFDDDDDDDDDSQDAEEESLPPPPQKKPEPPVVVTPDPPKPDPLDEAKLEKLAVTAASKAVEESRAKAAEEEAARRKAEEAAKAVDLHKDCRTMEEVVDLFWTLVYCVVAVHVFFVLVFLSRGFVREAVPIVVLGGITFVAGFLVDLVNKP